MKDSAVQKKIAKINYQELAVKLIVENKLYFYTGLVIFSLVIYAGVKEYRPSLSNFKISAPMVINTGLLTNQLKNKSIDYISPSGTSQTDGLKKPDEQGQISAISSGQVTYSRNKYIVKRGDSLASIALAVYGDRNAWVRIAQANNLRSPDYIEVGMELVIPR